MGKINEVGNKYGYLTVIEDDGTRTPDRQIKWKCRCDNIQNHKDGLPHFVHIVGGSLRRKVNPTVSCGCTIKNNSIKNLLGMKFGYLEVIKDTKKHNQTYRLWECKCHNCGRLVTLSSKDLLGRQKISCGCLSSSKGEFAISKILHSLNIAFVKEKTFIDCINPKTKYSLRFDFYLPDYNCCIEYDGEQHFKEWTLSSDSLQERQERDYIKNQYCETHNIHLIRIPYFDLKHISKEYLLERIQSIV